jgi:hypothetical protein
MKKLLNRQWLKHRLRFLSALPQPHHLRFHYRKYKLEAQRQLLGTLDQ